MAEEKYLEKKATIVGFKRLNFETKKGDMVQGVQAYFTGCVDDDSDSVSFPIKYWFKDIKVFDKLNKIGAGNQATILFGVNGTYVVAVDIK